jgi:hypothetical protein
VSLATTSPHRPRRFSWARASSSQRGCPPSAYSDAKITKASGSKATGYYLVIYYSKKPVKDVLQGHLDALAKLGYTEDWKDLTSSADGEVIMSIGATNGKSRSQVLIRGGGKSGSGGNGYWVQMNPFLKS